MIVMEYFSRLNYVETFQQSTEVRSNTIVSLLYTRCRHPDMVTVCENSALQYFTCNILHAVLSSSLPLQCRGGLVPEKLGGFVRPAS